MSVIGTGGCSSSLLIQCFAGSELNARKVESIARDLSIVDYIYLFFKDPMHFRVSIERVYAERREKIFAVLVHLALNMPNSDFKGQFHAVYEDLGSDCYVYRYQKGLIIAPFKLTEVTFLVAKQRGLVQFLPDQSCLTQDLKTTILNVTMENMHKICTKTGNTLCDWAMAWAYTHSDKKYVDLAICAILGGRVLPVVCAIYVQTPDECLMPIDVRKDKQGKPILVDPQTDSTLAQYSENVFQADNKDESDNELGNQQHLLKQHLLLLYKYHANMVKAIECMLEVWHCQQRITSEELARIRPLINQKIPISIIGELFMAKHHICPHQKSYDLFCQGVGSTTRGLRTEDPLNQVLGKPWI